MTATYPWSTAYKSIFYANSVIADVITAEEDTDEDSREYQTARERLYKLDTWLRGRRR